MDELAKTRRARGITVAYVALLVATEAMLLLGWMPHALAQVSDAILTCAVGFYLGDRLWRDGSIVGAVVGYSLSAIAAANFLFLMGSFAG